jgi:hypothetical protein
MKKAYRKPVFRELSKAEALPRLDDGGPPKALGARVLRDSEMNLVSVSFHRAAMNT